MIIYKTTNLVNGKSYIGKTVREWNGYLGSGKIILRAIEKYGRENFKREILERCSREELSEREIYWIAKLKPDYNIAKGGEGGDTFTNNPNKDIIREKIRKIHKGRKNTQETRRRMSEVRMGIKFTEEHKKNLCIARRKRVTTEETKRRMSKAMKGKINIKKYIMIDPDGNEYITEQGLTLFCEMRNLQSAIMHKVLNGERKHHRGWTIRTI